MATDAATNAATDAATNAAVLDEMAKPPPPYSGPTQSTPATPSAQPRPAPATLVTPLKQLGETPQNIDCPFCQRQTKTRVTLSSSSATAMATVACCLCTGLLCVWVPAAFHWCADVDHYCAQCNAHVVHIPYDGVPQVKDPAHRPGKVVSKHAPQMQPQMQAQPQVQPKVPEVERGLGEGGVVVVGASEAAVVEAAPGREGVVAPVGASEAAVVEAAPGREKVVAPVGASEAAVVEGAPGREGVVTPVGASEAAVVDSEQGLVEGSGAVVAPTQENDPVVIHSVK